MRQIVDTRKIIVTLFLLITGFSLHAQVFDLLKKELKERGKQELKRFAKKEAGVDRKSVV